jgi:hypothetical protein
MLAGMSHGLSLSPAGRLVYQGEPEPTAAELPVLSPRDAEQVAAAFAVSSAAGLIELGINSCSLPNATRLPVNVR